MINIIYNIYIYTYININIHGICPKMRYSTQFMAILWGKTLPVWWFTMGHWFMRSPGSPFSIEASRWNRWNAGWLQRFPLSLDGLCHGKSANKNGMMTGATPMTTKKNVCVWCIISLLGCFWFAARRCSMLRVCMSLVPTCGVKGMFWNAMGDTLW